MLWLPLHGIWLWSVIFMGNTCYPLPPLTLKNQRYFVLITHISSFRRSFLPSCFRNRHRIASDFGHSVCSGPRSGKEALNVIDTQSILIYLNKTAPMTQWRQNILKYISVWPGPWSGKNDEEKILQLFQSCPFFDIFMLSSSKTPRS